MARIGVLALQGGFDAHLRALRSLGHDAVPIRYAAQLDTLTGLVLPGGESTTQLRLIGLQALEEPLDAFVRTGAPVLATCAGLILAAATVDGPAQRSFGWLDVTVTRNAWGRQLDSFQAQSDGPDGFPLVFIRAPRITAVGSGVDVVATFRGEPVLVRAGAFVGAAFHPELTADLRVHESAFGRAA